MTAHRRAAQLALLTAVLLAGCSSGTGSASETATASATGAPTGAAPPSSAAPASPAAAPATTGAQVPAERSALPDGVYRTQLTIDHAKQLGLDDPGNAGTWTLTVKAGTFKLECVPTSTPGVECGNKDPRLPAVVEVGTLRGTGNTVWFVHDQELLVKLSGCVPDSQKSEGCGTQDPYHFDWKRAGNGLQFNNYVGFGGAAGFPELSTWTVQPWTRIA
ncbi:hypothetical protein [Micromonospora kangleipakensis]|nr:hypothetical protein [Micromonospora kangleipakensis]